MKPSNEKCTPIFSVFTLIKYPELFEEPILFRRTFVLVHSKPWSSLVEEDDQQDWPNSQIIVELFHGCVVLIFSGLTYAQQLSAWADTAFISFYYRAPCPSTST